MGVSLYNESAEKQLFKEQRMSDYGGLEKATYPSDYPAQAQARMISQPTLQQRLDLAVASAEERLKAVTEAREIFKKNPDLEKLLNLMQRGLF